MAQQQSEVIISLAVSIRFNFSSRLHLPESLDCVTAYRWNQCRAAESLYLSKTSQAPPKGKRSVHICLEMHTLVHRHIHVLRPVVPGLFIHSASLHTSFYCMYIYISTHRHVQMPTWGVFRVAGLRLNWLCLWVCISLDPSSGSSPF